MADVVDGYIFCTLEASDRLIRRGWTFVVCGRNTATATALALS